MSDLFHSGDSREVVKPLSVGRRYRIEHSRRGMIIGTVLSVTSVAATVAVEAIREGESVVDGKIYVRRSDCQWTRLKETAEPEKKFSGEPESQPLNFPQ